MLKIEYKGKDITEDISVNQCVHDMYAEKKADALLLRVNDVSGLWDEWQPQPGDELKAIYGAITTGKMYISECKPINGLYTLKATAAPIGYNAKNNKTWQRVRLLQIGQEIAARHGLAFKSYNVVDHTYNYILQANMDDFTFLSKRCVLEGCALIVQDGTLIMYDQRAMEQQLSEKVLNLSTDATFEFRDQSASRYGKCELECGVYAGAFNANNGSNNVLRTDADIYAGSRADVSRFAKNLLRDANKNVQCGYMYGRIMTGYAAGSCALLKNAKAHAWDGQVFLTHVRNDYVNCRMKIFFRKPLEGY